jgi:hypothetical protein
MAMLVDGIGLVIPGLELWTRTAWLVDHPTQWSALAGIVGHGTLFVVVLAAAAVFDFYRRNF